jgi:hypothetical protein
VAACLHRRGAVELGWPRFIEASGIRPDGWTESAPLPWADPGQGLPGNLVHRSTALRTADDRHVVVSRS